MKPVCIGIFAHRDKLASSDAFMRLVDRLTDPSVSLWVEREVLDYLGQRYPDRIGALQPLGKDVEHLNLGISLGGDGTFLHTARRLRHASCPILGVNLGRLGFLTDLDLETTLDQVDRLRSGDYQVEERSLIAVEVNGEYLGEALNEISVLKRDTGSMLTIHTTLDDIYLASYECDGLVVATPTGSTAYSLSAFGPLMTPKCRCFILTPIAPHSLTMRPLVISDEGEVRLEVDSRNESYLLVLDGESHPLCCRDKICLRRSERTVGMVRLSERSFADTLRQKLLWGTRLRD